MHFILLRCRKQESINGSAEGLEKSGRRVEGADFPNSGCMCLWGPKEYLECLKPESLLFRNINNGPC